MEQYPSEYVYLEKVAELSILNLVEVRYERFLTRLFYSVYDWGRAMSNLNEQIQYYMESLGYVYDPNYQLTAERNPSNFEKAFVRQDGQVIYADNAKQFYLHEQKAVLEATINGIHAVNQPDIQDIYNGLINELKELEGIL